MGTDTRASTTEQNIEKITTNPLSKKINKILDSRLEADKDTLEALKEISTFFPENTLRSRRNLRGQIERRSVAINEVFVKALRDVKIAVDNIYTDVNEMNRECLDMKKKLQRTKSETRHLIQQTNSLQSQSQKLQMQEEMVEAFLKVFQLTSEEMLAIKGSSKDSPISPEFFTALEKTQIIRNNTKYLLQTGHQKTALDIMEQMNIVREAGLERLYRWFQSQSRNPDPSSLLPLALAALQERPVLYKMILEDWTVVRRGWLSRGFLDALTLGGPGGAPRPIELQAHDPLRYVGDMLAWVHQALPSERESAQTLFSKCLHIDITEQVQIVVGAVSESICRPLKTRLEQVIVSEQGKEGAGGKKAVQLYKISSLLFFYKATISQVTGKGILISTLEELHHLSHKIFLSTLQNQVHLACERVEPPGETLAPSSGVARTLSLLTEIVTAATVSDDSYHDFKQIINCVVDPLLNAINESASSLGVVESAVYLLNCLHQLHSTLSLLHTSSEKLEMLQGQIEAQLDTLSQEQISAVFHSLGVATMYPVIINSPPVPLSDHPSCQPLAVQSFVRTLDSFLSAPDHLMFPHIRFLLSSSYRKQLQSRTSKAVVHVYSHLHSLVYMSENGYTDPNMLMPKSPEIVKGLLLL